MDHVISFDDDEKLLSLLRDGQEPRGRHYARAVREKVEAVFPIARRWIDWIAIYSSPNL
jgi:hypothetical protein